MHFMKRSDGAVRKFISLTHFVNLKYKMINHNQISPRDRVIFEEDTCHVKSS